MKYLLSIIIIFAVFVPGLAWADTKTSTTIGDSSNGDCFNNAKLEFSLGPNAGPLSQVVSLKGKLVVPPSVIAGCLIDPRFSSPRIYTAELLAGNSIDNLRSINGYRKTFTLSSDNLAYDFSVESKIEDIVSSIKNNLELKNAKDIFFRLSIEAPGINNFIVSTVAYNIRVSGEFGANLVCAVNVAGTKATVCNLGSKNDTLISIPKDISCKNGELCDYCNNQYQPFCQDSDNLPDGTVPGCIAIESKDCTDVNRGYYYCSKKTGKCEKESDVEAGDRVGDRQNNPSCSNICSRTSTTEGGGSPTKPSEDISFSYKIPNLLAGKAENLGELIDYVLSAVLKFAIPIAVLFIIFQGVRLLLNPIMDSLNYKSVPEKEVLNNIGVILVALAIIFIGRGFVTLIISILNPPS